MTFLGFWDSPCARIYYTLKILRSNMPYGVKLLFIVMRMARKTVMAVPERIASMMAIWYLMAVIGLAPPRMTPVIIPGRDTRPIVAMVATVGARAD